jgi:hypothetical protein
MTTDTTVTDVTDDDVTKVSTISDARIEALRRRRARGLFYVTLTGVDGVLLMCYRVRNDGKLKRMLRIPVELRGEKT